MKKIPMMALFCLFCCCLYGVKVTEKEPEGWGDYFWRKMGGMLASDEPIISDEELIPIDAQNVRFHKRLFATEEGRAIFEREIEEQGKRHPQINFLDVSGTDIMDADLALILRHVKRIRKISFRDCKLLTKLSVALLHRESVDKKIRSVDFSNTGLTDDWLQVLQENVCIEEFIFEDLPGLTDKGLGFLNPKVKSIVVSRCLNCGFTRIDRFTNLEQLEIKNSRTVTDRVIERCPGTLIHLDLSGCKRIRGTNIGRLTNLEELLLEGCRVVADDTALDEIMKLKHLKILNVYETSLTNKSLEKLRKPFIGKNGKPQYSLNKLKDLSYKYVGNADAKTVDRAFELCSRISGLERIRIGGLYNAESIKHFSRMNTLQEVVFELISPSFDGMALLDLPKTIRSLIINGISSSGGIEPSPKEKKFKYYPFAYFNNLKVFKMSNLKHLVGGIFMFFPPTLEELAIHRCGEQTKLVNVANLTHLKKLALTGCSSGIMEQLPKIHNLQELRLTFADQSPLSAEDVIFIPNKLRLLQMTNNARSFSNEFVEGVKNKFRDSKRIIDIDLPDEGNQVSFGYWQ